MLDKWTNMGHPEDCGGHAQSRPNPVQALWCCFAPAQHKWGTPCALDQGGLNVSPFVPRSSKPAAHVPISFAYSRHFAASFWQLPPALAHRAGSRNTGKEQAAMPREKSSTNSKEAAQHLEGAGRQSRMRVFLGAIL